MFGILNENFSNDQEIMRIRNLKTNRKWLAVIMAVIMVCVMMSACGGNSGGGDASENSLTGVWKYEDTENGIGAVYDLKDDGTGTLKAEVTGNNPTVTNSYEAKPVTLGGDTALKVTKKVTGHDSAEEYRFSLTPAADNPQGGVSIAQNGDTAKTTGKIEAGKSQTVSFGDVTFRKAGKYRFTVKETNENAPNGWTYANKDVDAKTITVTVTDDEQGQLHAEADKAPEFVNSYKAEPAVLEGDTALKVTKAVDGHKAVESFTFRLSLKSGAAENVRISDGDDTAVTGNGIEAGHSETLSFGKVTISKAGGSFMNCPTVYWR